MKKWLVMAMALSAVCFLVNFSWGAGGVEVQGIVANWKQLKDKVPQRSYFQLIKYHKELKGTTDSEGFSAIESKLPKIKIKPDGSFKLVVKELSDGNYFIALQKALPKEMSGESIATAIPILITEKEEPLIIQVPGDYPLNVGKVFVAVRGKKEKQEAPATPAPEKAKEEAEKAPSPEKPEKEAPAPAPPKND
ncbi:MAG: hypothetical protein WAU47_15035 [Desulfobaccales bacterium]